MEDSREFNEKILAASKESIQKMLKVAEMPQLARALYGVTDSEVVNKITQEQSPFAKGMLMEELQLLDQEAESRIQLNEAKNEILKLLQN